MSYLIISKIMIYFFVILYALFLFLLYFFIIKRLKNLSYKHMNDTWLPSLWRWYKIVKRRLIVILVIMFFVSSYLFFSFFDNGILYKIWLYNNQETLSDFTF